MTVNLPRLNQTGANEWSDVEDNDIALKEAIEELQSEFKDAVNPVTWYAPKVIATEESRTNTAYGTLTTADEITNVVVPENGIVKVYYEATVKSSASSEGHIGLFIGSNQVQWFSGNFTTSIEQTTSGTTFKRLLTNTEGLEVVGAFTGAITTGRVMRGMEIADLTAGTYAVKMQYKAGTGSVTAKERTLRVATIG